MPLPSPRPHITVSLDGLGTFVFRRRTLGDDIRILAIYDRLTEGVAAPSTLLDALAGAVATYQTLAVGWPGEAWHPARIADMDTLADERTADLLRIHGAFSAREDEFRPPEKRRGAAAGAGAIEEPGGVVPTEIQPPAD